MANSKLEEYISAKRKIGASDESIRTELISHNWPATAVDEAFGITVPTPDAHLLSTGELFLKTFTTFKEKFLSSFLILLFPVFMVFIISSVVGFTTALYSKNISFALEGSNIVGVMAAITVIFLVVAILTIIVEVWGVLALSYNLLHKEKIGTLSSYKHTWKLIRSYWWISGLVIMITIPGYLCLLVPGIMLGIWFCFSQFVLLEENIKGLGALQKSREYVRGYGWSIFLRLLVLFIPIVVISSIFSFVVKESKIEENLIVIIIGALSSATASIFIVAFMANMFRNIKSLKGNIDITGKSKKGMIVLLLLGILFLLAIPIYLFTSLTQTINLKKTVDNTYEWQSSRNKLLIEEAVVRYHSSMGEWPKNKDDLLKYEMQSIPEDPDINICYQVIIDNNPEKVKVNSNSKVGPVCDLEIIVN